MNRMRPRLKKLFILIIPVLAIILTGCSDENVLVQRPTVFINQFEKRVHTKVEVVKGDISPTFTLTAELEDYEETSYGGLEDTMEVDQLFVEEGSEVKKGDVLITFKADDEETDKKRRDYVERMKEDELLIEHLERNALIDQKSDYYTDYSMLKNDLELLKTSIEEIDKEMEKLTVIATADGMVTYISKDLYNGYAKSAQPLLKTANGSDYFKAVTKEQYDFKIGDEYIAQTMVTSFKLLVADVIKEGADTTVYFSPIEADNLLGLGEQCQITIKKDMIKDTIYVDSQAIRSNENGNFVYVVDEDGFLTAKKVVVKCVVDTDTVIESGLEGGEWVAID